MQSTEVSRIKLNTEVTFIPRQQNNRSRRESDIKDVESNRVRHGKLVSYKHYSLDGAWWLGAPSEAVVTDERQFGFMISVENNQGETVYTIVTARNIIATRSDYEAYWIPENERRRVEAIAQAEQAERNRQRQQARTDREMASRASMNEASQRIADTVRNNIKALLGAEVAERLRHSVSVQGEWVGLDTPYEDYRIVSMGTVTLEIRDFQRLLEMAIAE